jgi:alpha-glucosidase
MHPMDVFQSFQHIHDLHRHETAVLFRQWRNAVADLGAILLGEMDTRDVPRFAEFVAGGDALHAAFVLQVGLGDWEPVTILETMLNYQVTAKGGCAWEVSNHDQARAVSRYGGGAQGLRRALALTSLMAVFDGMLFVYQGEELGLPDAVLMGPVEDPMSSRNGEGMWSRDVSRGPMPWTSAPVNGFTTADAAWLSTAPLPAEFTAEQQVADPASTWHRYQAMIALRRQHPQLWQAPFELVEHGTEHLVIRRGNLLVVANLGEQPVEVPAVAGATAVFSSDALPSGTTVAPESTVVFATAG